MYLRCKGGEVGATSALAPKISLLGLSPKKVGDDIAKATSDWKGLRITHTRDLEQFMRKRNFGKDMEELPELEGELGKPGWRQHGQGQNPKCTAGSLPTTGTKPLKQEDKGKGIWEHQDRGVEG
ncbi:hypothetical protein GH733_009971 [Mirounga leonina]|nr:hypothetical protein GH733_009971 [Mirounga leonina]